MINVLCPLFIILQNFLSYWDYFHNVTLKQNLLSKNKHIVNNWFNIFSYWQRYIAVAVSRLKSLPLCLVPVFISRSLESYFLSCSFLTLKTIFSFLNAFSLRLFLSRSGRFHSTQFFGNNLSIVLLDGHTIATVLFLWYGITYCNS